eukprot:CAMPEP_0195532252 /NCGR_PEP_ID=MMETSP0794_2-20130614/37672_1 /TAXON_ID=515487 /ORGANISM="Stephanopyxis turris, Strain CCMP 815" /LENGTH=43 /DNA_ID= /DNA_START= /DNA_END= /DNA_ORIENTATION=
MPLAARHNLRLRQSLGHFRGVGNEEEEELPDHERRPNSNPETS